MGIIIIMEFHTVGVISIENAQLSILHTVWDLCKAGLLFVL